MTFKPSHTQATSAQLMLAMALLEFHNYKLNIDSLTDTVHESLLEDMVKCVDLSRNEVFKSFLVSATRVRFSITLISMDSLAEVEKASAEEVENYAVSVIMEQAKIIMNGRDYVTLVEFISNINPKVHVLTTSVFRHFLTEL